VAITEKFQIHFVPSGEPDQPKESRVFRHSHASETENHLSFWANIPDGDPPTVVFADLWSGLPACTPRRRFHQTFGPDAETSVARDSTFDPLRTSLRIVEQHLFALTLEF
jgi:hypothetical protein